MKKPEITNLLKSKKFKIIIKILIIIIIITTTIAIIHKENEKTKQEILQNIQEVIPDKLLPENYSINADKEFKAEQNQIKYKILTETITRENSCDGIF